MALGSKHVCFCMGLNLSFIWCEYMVLQLYNRSIKAAEIELPKLGKNSNKLCHMNEHSQHDPISTNVPRDPQGGKQQTILAEKGHVLLGLCDYGKNHNHDYFGQ